jgi:sugar phosphate isomerase/epimerase
MMTHATGIDLIASCWTTAGDAEPYAGIGENRERSPLPLLDRIAASASAGWRGFGFVHADLIEARETLGFSRVKSALEEHGIRHVQVEFLNDWWTSGERRDASDVVRHDLLEAAEVLGATELKLAGNYSWNDPVPQEVMAAEFAVLSQQAAEVGTRVALEPLPFSNFSTIELGADFVRSVGHPAGGLVVDIWHVYRGGTPIQDLTNFLDPSILFAVELNDALLAEPEDLWIDTIHHRLLPGEGEWDLPGFIDVIRSCGYDGPWGVEIISESFRKLPLDVALSRAFTTTMETFRASRRGI